MRRLVISLFTVSLLLVTTLAVAAFAQPQNFRAHLTGDAENPPVETRATGQAVFKLSHDGTELSYRLIAANIENVLMAHIHCGAPDVNGPVIAWLYPEGPPPVLIPGRFSGVLATGTATVTPVPDSEECPGGVANFEELMDRIRSGDAYVNVHTEQNPGGEIRGQIR